MAFTMPTFNLDCDIYRQGAGAYGSPDVTSLGNLTPGERSLLGVIAVSTSNSTPMELLLPPHTDIRPEYNGLTADWVEVPSGSGRFYQVAYVDDIGKGFANEHRFALIVMVRFNSGWHISGVTPGMPAPLP